MSGPTKGMVAGQPIRTGAQTKEFDEGHERTFGERKPVRGRFVYTQGGDPLPEPIQVSGDFTGAERRAPKTTEELTYGGARATDGTDISSKRKHREYMKQNNLAMADDYKQTWAKSQAEREAYSRGERIDPSLREDVGRSIHELEKKSRR